MKNNNCVVNYKIVGLNLLLWRWCNCDLTSFARVCMYQGLFDPKSVIFWLKHSDLIGNFSYKKQFIKAYSDFIKNYPLYNEK